MIVGRGRQRNHDRRLARRRKLGTRRSPGTADYQIALAKLDENIRDKWPNVRRRKR